MLRLNTLLFAFAVFFSLNPVLSQPNFILGNDTVLCDSVFELSLSGYDVYEWSTGSSDSSIWAPVPGVYHITATNYDTIPVYNGDFELGNIGFTTDYTYDSVSIWNNGKYWIGADASLVHVNFVGTSNPQGSGGDFMIVNGGSFPGAAVWEQNIQVEPGSKYEISFWASSLVAGSPAILWAVINNISFNTPQTCPDSINSWVKFNFTGPTGGDSIVNFTILNQNTMFNGNDFGIDDISIVKVETKIDSIVLDYPYILPSFNYLVNSNTSFIEVTFNNTSIGDGICYWDFGDGNTSINPNPTHTYYSTGNYEVCLTKEGMCDTLVYCETLYLQLNSTLNVVHDDLHVYPNPAVDKLHIEGIRGTYSLRLFDLFGSMIYSSTQNENFYIDVSTFSNGVYLINLDNGNEKHVKRIVVIH